MTWMTRAQCWRRLLGALSCAVLLSTSLVHAGPRTATGRSPGPIADANAESARLARQLWEWYGQASDLHDAGKLDEAWEIYQKIWQHRQTYDVATSMAGICMHRQQFARAAHYYHVALREMVPTQTPEFVASVTREFESARSKTTEVTIEVQPPDVQGLVIEDLDRQEHVELPLYLVPGTTQLRATADGYPPRTFTIDARPGLQVTWNINFNQPEGASGARPIDDSKPASRTTSTRHPWVVFPVGGLVTAGLAAGAAINFDLGQQRYNEVRDIHVPPNACNANRQRAECESIRRLKREGDRADALGLGLSIGAGAMAIATVVTYWLWETEVPVEVQAGKSSAMLRWGYDF